MVQAEDPEERRTWGDCWRCDQHIDDCDELSAKEARAVGGCTPNQMPLVPDMPLTHFGMYAPQLAWWLSFFPPENFVVLTSEELHDPDRVCLLYTSPSPRDLSTSRMPSSA